MLFGFGRCFGLSESSKGYRAATVRAMSEIGPEIGLVFGIFLK